MRVEKYFPVQIFCTVLISSPFVGVNNSWKDMRPIRATESIVVIARADTHIVIMQAEMLIGRPNMVKNPAIADEKIWKGVPLGKTPFCAAEQAITKATTPRVDSTSMEPYPTQSISFSLETVLEDVPEDTRL